jgi:hypothetical protein
MLRYVTSFIGITQYLLQGRAEFVLEGKCQKQEAKQASQLHTP